MVYDIGRVVCYTSLNTDKRHTNMNVTTTKEHKRESRNEQSGTLRVEREGLAKRLAQRKFLNYQTGLPVAARWASFQERTDATLVCTSSRHAEADTLWGYVCLAFGKGHHTLA